MYFQFLIEDSSTEIIVNHIMEKLQAKYKNKYIGFDTKSFRGYWTFTDKG